MRVPFLSRFARPAARWSAYVIAIVLAAGMFGAARPASAQCIICPDEEPPEVVVSAPSTSYSGTGVTYSVSVTVEWCDNLSLNQNTMLINLNGVTVSGAFTYENHTKPGCILAKKSVGNLDLVHGTNTIYAEIRDNNGNFGSGSLNITYTQTHRAPDWGLDPHNGENLSMALCTVNCFDAVYTYTTPAYMSMDTPRAVTLVYRSAQAKAMGLVQVNMGDVSTVLANKVSLRLKRPDGSFVTFTNGTSELYFAGDSQHVSRLAAQFDAGSLATGVHNYSLVLTNYWTVSGISQSTTVPVKVLIVNEKDSPFGWGWSLAGLQRLHANGDTLLALTEGDGSIAMFRRTTCPSGCSYISPAGDVSTLTSRASVGGDGIKWDRKYPDGTTASFNTTGELLLIKDLYGNQTTYGYTSGRLTTITDPAGKVITLAYGGDNKIETITDPGGRVVTVTIDGALNVTTIQEPGGGNALQSATYDGSHRLTGYADKRGGAWGIAYDFAGKLAGDTLPTIRADGSDVRPVVGYSSQERTVLVDPASGTGSSGTPARRLKWDTVYVSATNPRGYATRMKLHGSGASSWVRDSLGRVSTVTRDALWRITRTTAPSGHVARLTWHATNRSQLLQQWDSLSATARMVDYEYHATLTGLVTRIKGQGRHTWFYYNSTTGHLDSTRSGYSSAPLQKFYARSDGRDTLHIDPDTFKTRFVYASSGFKNTDTVVTHGDRRTALTYDSHGRVLTTRDPIGYVTTAAYDALNRVTSTVGPSLDTTLYEYDSLYLKVVRDAIGQRYRFATNALGWVDTLVPPDSSVRITYRYDRNGNRHFFVNRRGQTVETTYDALDRELVINALTDTLTFAYDATDRWMSVKNRESIDTVKFDLAGRLTAAITRRGPTSAIRRQVTSLWDDALDLRTRYEITTDPGSLSEGTVGFTYNDFHQLQSFNRGSPGYFETTFGYNARRLANSARLPNALEVFTNYPSTRRPGQTSYDNAAVNAALGLNYSHDKLSRVAEISRPGNDTIRVNGYDGLGRIIVAEDYVDTQPVCSWDPANGFVCDPAGRVLIKQLVFGYDKVGNRNDSSAVINTGNRLRVYGVHSMDYDADGNLVRKYKTADSTAFNQRLYWDALGRLDSVYTTRGGVLAKVRFGYDGFGRRVRKTTDAGTTRFVYDGDNLILELDSAGIEVVEYTYYPGIDRPHGIAEGLYFLTDQLGSVVGLVRDDKSLAAKYRYSPFGVQTDSTVGVANPFRFAGREYDAETGLYYNRARYYDPHVGRFVSEDPIGLAGGINVYAYVGNDPVNGRDPLGLDPCTSEQLKNGWVETLLLGGGTECKSPTTLPPVKVSPPPAPPLGPPPPLPYIPSGFPHGHGPGPGIFPVGGGEGGGRGVSPSTVPGVRDLALKFLPKNSCSVSGILDEAVNNGIRSGIRGAAFGAAAGGVFGVVSGGVGGLVVGGPVVSVVAAPLTGIAGAYVGLHVGGITGFYRGVALGALKAGASCILR